MDIQQLSFKLIKRGLIGLFYWIWGHLIAFFRYDKRYLQGKWFTGKMGGICAQGWKWVVDDYHTCKRMRVFDEVGWPVNPQVHIICPENLEFHPDDLNNFQSFGIYFQALGKIVIGKGTYIAPNVGLITSNHSISNLDLHDEPRPIVLGEKCWIGMNSVILPGVTLGDGTIVGAGSVVTKSFPEGNCVIVGNPARILRHTLPKA